MFDTDGLKIMKGLTDATMQRQQILSSNLANIETNGYVRQDIDFGLVLRGLKSDIPALGGNESVLTRSRYKDDNPMTLESELSKLYDNHLRYVLLVKSIGHHFDHMKKALEVRAN